MAERVESINAITLITADMAASVAFYEVLECEVAFGGTQASFTTLRLGNAQFLNLLLDPTWVRPTQVWGRFILWVDEVDAVYDAFIAAGYTPTAPPSDASWGERYFHIVDPAGHEVSIATPLG